MTEGLIDDERRGFRAGRRRVLYPKANRRESTREKMWSVFGLMDLEKSYDRVNREALCKCFEYMMWVVNC